RPMLQHIRRPFAVLSLVSAALFPLGVSAQDAQPPREYAAVAEQLERFIEREMRVQGLPIVSIALVDDQRVLWSKGFGVVDSATGRVAGSQTVFRVGSVSKLFTDVAIMQLVEQGKVDLDAPVTRYLPDFHPHNPYGKTITLRQLMSHRAGLVREPPVGSYFDSTSPPLAATIASLNRTTLVYPPESHTKYSNAAIATVGLVLERVSGVPFPQALSRAVLEPLGMTSSGFAPTPALTRDLAPAEMWTLDGRTFAAPAFQLGIAPAGSMYTTVTDLARFVSALFAAGRGVNGQLLKTETIAQMWTPQFARPGEQAGYGIGFRLGTLDGHRSVGHDGAIYGFATTLQALPDDKLGVIVVTTRDGANAPVDEIGEVALRGMLAARAAHTGGVAVAGSQAGTMDTTAAVSPARARRLVGRYAPRASPAREIEIAHRGTGLAVLPAGGGGIPELRARGDTLVVDDRVFGTGSRFLPNADSATMLRTGEALADTLVRVDRGMPRDAKTTWRGLLGEYGPDYDILYVYERDGRLWALIEWFFPYPLTEVSRDTFAFPTNGLYDGERIVFARDKSGRATEATAAGVRFARRNIEPKPGTNQLRITPLRPVAELRREALAATPPAENGSFRETDLVELVKLDPTIKLEIRYATSNNFLGTQVYDEARAFMQRPAAQALVRAHHALKSLGYGLLIHDAYRPWYVTKIFWDATPTAKKWLVANPAEGSKHNRGSAVDLTLYDLRTGKPVEMVSTYDESTERAYAEYPGGTSLQRWYRELLRQAMEAQGFTVNPQEWWHFDHEDWRNYRIGNVPFSQIR
ncbi:MAG TPA: serine hydrolase, partial [Gemmatimonadaceae bacterium]|nr:serine hydrolase [Gemmatimonadaceae bacterium]